jgi:hydrogenase-4 component F
MTIFFLLAASMIAALVPFLFTEAKYHSRAALLMSTLVLIGALSVAVPVLLGGDPVVSANHLWYVDGLSALLVALIGIIQWTATIVSGPYLATEVEEGVVTPALVRRYYSLLALFVFVMFVSVLSDNLGVLWIALEATTLATTFLVAFYARPTSLEAAWKYLIVCSTGIALGLVALLVVYTAATGSGVAEGLDALRFSVLSGSGALLPGAMLKVAFAFALVGYGTKVGLAPMHTWLPDAHSSAPAPVSALLSGVLLNSALLALLRYKGLTDVSLGSNSFTNMLLLGFGVLTIAVSAAFIFAQKDYKRLLAYSSMEHMGFTVLSVSLGAIGAVAAVIEIVGHALTKSMLFFSAGSFLQRFHSTKFARVADAYRIMPINGAFFLIGTFFLLGAPFSPIFMSEYFAIAAGIDAHPIAIAIVLAALTLALAGFIMRVMPMLFSKQAAEPSEHPIREGERVSRTTFALSVHLVLLLAFFGLIVSGVAMPMITRIAALIS